MMHICNFSLLLKTASGAEKEVKWNRKYYTYTLLDYPTDAISIMIRPVQGKVIELIIKNPPDSTGDKFFFAPVLDLLCVWFINYSSSGGVYCCCAFGFGFDYFPDLALQIPQTFNTILQRNRFK
jgi:hypothetical protein